MKHRALTLAFAACLVSSLALADNPADAPLVTDDGNTAVAHQEEDCKDHNRRPKNRKDKSLRANRKDAPNVPSHNSREELQSNPEYPANANN